jgi:hypothetical protein
MKKWISVICGSLLVGLADAAIAQTPVPTADGVPRLSVAGALFGDFKRFSSDESSPPLDGSALGGEARVATFLASHWSLEFDAGLSRMTTSAQSLVQVPVATPAVSGNVPSGNAVVPGQIRFSATNRPLAVSAVVGYHSAPLGRMTLRYLGGISFLHFTRQFQGFPGSGSTGSSVLGSSAAPNSVVVAGSPVEQQTDNLPAAVVGVEAQLALAAHWAIVPEFRATAFGSNAGQPGGVFLRPGLGFRWWR